MAAYDWPGNVRELRNVVESMLVQDQDGVLGLDDLQEGDVLRQSSGDRRGAGPQGFVGRPLAEVERWCIEQALELTQGNREEASKMLGIGERTLYRTIQAWKLQDQVKDALAQAKGDLKEAARLLGTKEGDLLRKMKKWGMASAAKAD
jgi:two-component system response regulator HydG